MSSLTSRASLYKPASGETVNVTTDINNNWDSIDLNMNFRSCTSGTRPSTKWDGLAIHETDTNRQYVWNSSPASSGWYEIYGAGGSISQINLSAATTATMSITSNTTGDGNKRLQIRGDGRLEWGSGSATPDAFIRRTGVNALTTDGDLTIVSTATVQSTTDSTALNVTGGGTFAKSLSVGGTASLGGGTGVLGLKNAATAPTTSPSSGIVLFSESGQFKSRNTSGSVNFLNGAMALSTTQTRASFTTDANLAVLTIPANDIVVGATYRIKAWGTAGSTGTPTYTFTAKIGGASGTSLGSIGVVTASGISGRPWVIDSSLVVLTSGGSGTGYGNIVFHGHLGTSGTSTTTAELRLGGATASAINWTASQDFVITVGCSANSASNTVTCQGAILERVS